MRRRRDGSACSSSPSSRRRRRLACVAAVAVSFAGGVDAASIVRFGHAAMTNLTSVASAGCGFMSWPSLAETHYAAVLSPSTQPEALTTHSRSGPSACGRCARVWHDDERAMPETRTQQDSAVVYIVDDQRRSWRANSATSTSSDLNLSPQVFQNLTGLPSGRVPVRWRFVDCPPLRRVDPTEATSTVDPIGCSVCLHRDSSAYRLAVQPVNDTLGVASIRINGHRAGRNAGSPSFFFHTTDHDGRFNLTRLELTVTTRSRRRFTRVVTASPGACVDLRRSDEVLGGIETPSPPAGSPTEEPTADEADEWEADETDAFTYAPAPSVTGQAETITVVPQPPSGGSNGGSAPLVPLVIPSVSPPPALSPTMTMDPLPPLATIRPASPPEASASPPPPPTSPSLVPSLAPVRPSPLPLPPAIQTVPSLTPQPIDREGGWPTPGPADAGLFGSGSGTKTRPAPSPTEDPPRLSSSPPPTPTIGRTPSGTLSGGVLTNPLFVGLLLGTVGLVGAIVAYRAKTRQSQRLALAPPATAQPTPRTEFATL